MDKPKYVITGNTIDELVIAAMDAVRRTQKVELKDAKKGGGQYGLWSWEKELTTKGMSIGTQEPLALGVTFVYRKLVDSKEFDKAAVARKAATQRNIETLREKLARLEAGE